jgi:probable phosphoglycerate mutase
VSAGRLLAHIDGGARGNPGPAGFGVHVAPAEPGAPATGLYGFLGVATNNVAEYAALLALLEHAVPLAPDQLEVRSDSLLLVRQMIGAYKVRDARLQVLHAAARRLAARLPRVTYVHVPREMNRDADALANRAMDEQASNVPVPAVIASLPPVVVQSKLSV